ncbi:MAG: hypothetical protein NC310_07070 [Roseburia sp.]|nr:hypothetical protein [Roseburia sp.]MCM1556645.1 hypothetical protein [Anaeroplasma bactoclasticum]
MKIIKTETDLYFNEKSRILGNCFLVIDDTNTYHFEFIVKKDEAKILCDTGFFLEEVTKEFHKMHLNIIRYYTENHNFYMSFEAVHTFKLPISILQVSEFFLNQTKLENLRKVLNLDTLKIPVQIIDDEYVVIKNHHGLYLALEEGYKMVEVYLDDINEKTKDYLYLAKEQNIKTVKDMRIISNEEYILIQKQLEEIF